MQYHDIKINFGVRGESFFHWNFFILNSILVLVINCKIDSRKMLWLSERTNTTVSFRSSTSY